MYTKWFYAQLYNHGLSFFHIFPSAKSIFPQRSTYQRMSPQPNESYGLQQRDRSLPAMPLPDLTTLPHEPTHQLTGKQPSCFPYIQHLEIQNLTQSDWFVWFKCPATGAPIVSSFFFKRRVKKNG